MLRRAAVATQGEQYLGGGGVALHKVDACRRACPTDLSAKLSSVPIWRSRQPAPADRAPTQVPSVHSFCNRTHAQSTPSVSLALDRPVPARVVPRNWSLSPLCADWIAINVCATEEQTYTAPNKPSSRFPSFYSLSWLYSAPHCELISGTDMTVRMLDSPSVSHSMIPSTSASQSSIGNDHRSGPIKCDMKYDCIIANTANNFRDFLCDNCAISV